MTACVNDRIANSGDALYLFRVIDGHLTLLRSPGDDELSSQLGELYDIGSGGRFTLTCHGWLDNQTFIARVTGAGYGVSAMDFDVHVTIDGNRFHIDTKSKTPIR